MNSLRWILAAAGLLLVLGIYVWGRIRRPATREYASLRREAGSDFSVDQKKSTRNEPPELKESVSPPVRQRAVSPPIISAVDDEIDTDALPPMHVESVDIDSHPTITASRGSDGMPRRREPSVNFEATQFAEESMSTGAFIGAQAQPREPVLATDTQQLHALQRSESEVKAEGQSAVDARATRGEQSAASAKSNAADLSRPTKRVASRKIVALRLSTGSARVEGAKLKSLLDDAHLKHGKYNIYHRLADDGTALFSVASMVEPGTFDPHTMSGQLFPGVTLFMQLPGAQPGAQLFEQLLSCARQLEQGLGGILQDERGLPLTEQRAQRLRDDIADFEHLLGG